MRYAISSLTLLLAVLMAAQSAIAAPVAGTRLNGTITQSFSSQNAYVGQPVVLTNVTSANGSGAVVGAKMYGTVTHVVRAGQGRTAQIQMTFNRLVLPNGTRYRIDGVVTGMNTNTKSNALKEAGGAVAGMIVGNIIGKTIFHMSGAGFLGAAGGYLIARNNRQNVSVPANSAVQVQLYSVRRQAGY